MLGGVLSLAKLCKAALVIVLQTWSITRMPPVRISLFASAHATQLSSATALPAPAGENAARVGLGKTWQQAHTKSAPILTTTPLPV
jgi:hypothetical protein